MPEYIMKRIVIVSIGLFLLAGCGPTHPNEGTVKGTITYNGKPVNGATLHLYPAAGGDIYTAVPVGQDGAFSTSDVPLGDYKVVVEGSTGMNGIPSTKDIPPDQLAKMQAQIDKMKTTPTIPFPDKYKQPETTVLTCKIVQGDQTLKLELKD